jgi:hypothetical protein
VRGYQAAQTTYVIIGKASGASPEVVATNHVPLYITGSTPGSGRSLFTTGFWYMEENASESAAARTTVTFMSELLLDFLQPQMLAIDTLEERKTERRSAVTVVMDKKHARHTQACLG